MFVTLVNGDSPFRSFSGYSTLEFSDPSSVVSASTYLLILDLAVLFIMVFLSTDLSLFSVGWPASALSRLNLHYLSDVEFCAL